MTSQQGHLWRVPLTPIVASVNPNSGQNAGGNAVTITGQGFIPGGTTFKFGGIPAVGIACASTTSCTATTPAGSGIVDVSASVTVPGMPFPATTGTLAGAFTYTTAVAPSVTAITPAIGPLAGGTSVTITGSGFATAAGAPAVSFGANAATGVTCGSSTSCTAVSPASASPVGISTADVLVTVGGLTSTAVPADLFTYDTAPIVTGLAPSTGPATGGTVVTISGAGFDTTGNTTVTFGGVATTPAGTFETCASTTSCLVTSPAGTSIVDVVVQDPGGTSAVSAADRFTYTAASTPAIASIAPATGVIAGGTVVTITGSGFTNAATATPIINFGTNAATFVSCANATTCTMDSPAHAAGAVDVTVVVNDPAAPATALTSPIVAADRFAVWRLTFDATTETMVADPIDGATLATAMTPLADVRTLKPNGMALGPLNPDGSLNTASPALGLYVTDLTEKYVRVITNPDGDPRTQTINIVAATGDGRGANGTQGFIGNYLYVSGNRAAQFFDVTLCPSVGNTVPPASPACGMASVPAPAGVFVSGTAVDPVRKLVYMSDSPGAAASIINRYDASHDVYVRFLDGAWNTPGSGVVIDLNGVVHCEAGTFGAYPPSAGIGCLLGPQAGQIVTGGNLPGPATANGTVVCALTCQRPWDQANHPTTSTTAPVPATFAFAFGLATDPNGNLIIAEDPSAGARSARGTMWTVPFVP